MLGFLQVEHYSSFRILQLKNSSSRLLWALRVRAYSVNRLGYWVPGHESAATAAAIPTIARKTDLKPSRTYPQILIRPSPFSDAWPLRAMCLKASRKVDFYCWVSCLKLMFPESYKRKSLKIPQCLAAEFGDGGSGFSACGTACVCSIIS